MIQFTGHLEVDRTVDEVFELLADMADLHRWNPNVSSSRRTSGVGLEPGSTYESVIVRGPLRMTARSTLVDTVPGRVVRYEGSISGFWSIDWMTFEPQEDRTVVTFNNQTRTPTWLRPLTPLINAVFQRQARRAVEGARKYLGAGSP